MAKKNVDDENIKIDVDDEPEKVQVKVINDKTEYKRMKEKYEKSWFKLKQPACYAVEEEGEVLFKTINDTKHIFEHERVNYTEDGKKKTVSFFDKWRKDKTIRIYDKVVFKPHPLVAKPTEYNLFNGFQVKETEIVPIDEFIEVLKALVNYDGKSYKYLCAYLADIIQNPAIQNRSHGKSIIFRGSQGSGKTSLFMVLKKIIGSKYITCTSDMNAIIKSKDNRFAGGAVNKILVCFEEVQSADGYSKADQLKEYITAEELEQELKGINGTNKFKNFARYISFTNHANSLKIECTDRRFVLFLSSEKLIDNVAFWKVLYDKINTDAYIYSIYKFFKDMDIKDFDFTDRPITDAYKRSKSHSIPYTIRFLANVVIQDKSSKRYTLNEMFLKFDSFLKDNKFKYEMTKPSFKGELNELVKGDIGLCKVKNSVIKYYVDEAKLRQLCKKRKFDLFDDDGDDNDDDSEVDPLEEGVKDIEDDSKIVIQDFTKTKKYQQLLKLFGKN